MWWARTRAGAGGQESQLLGGHARGVRSHRLPSGPASQQLIGRPTRCPISAEHDSPPRSQMVMRSGETTTAAFSGGDRHTARDWAWARCNVDGAPAFRHTDGTQICLKKRLRRDQALPGRVHRQRTRTCRRRTLCLAHVYFFKHSSSTTPARPNPVAQRAYAPARRGVRSRATSCAAAAHGLQRVRKTGTACMTACGPVICRAAHRAETFRWAQPDGVLELTRPARRPAVVVAQ